VPVQPASLEILEKADVPPAQARAIVQAIEIELAGAKETLSTKQDILILRHDVSELGADLRHEMEQLRGGVRQQIVELRGEVRQELAELRGELHQEFTGLRGELRQEMSELRHGLEIKIASVDSRITSLDAKMVTQRQLSGTVFGAILGQMTVLLGVAYFFVTHLQH